MDLFAIDPSAEKFKKSFQDKKINLIVDYFSKEKIYNYLNSEEKVKKKFSLITSFAMFYDIEDPNSFCKDVENLLEKMKTDLVTILINLNFAQKPIENPKKVEIPATSKKKMKRNEII